MCPGVDIRAPCLVADRFVLDWRRLGNELAGELAPDGIRFIRARRPDYIGNKLARTLPLEAHSEPLLCRPRKGLDRGLGAVRWDPKFLKLFAVHGRVRVRQAFFGGAGQQPPALPGVP